MARLRSRHFLMRGEIQMPDFELLYHIMLNASEDALAALKTGNVWDAKRTLIDAEQKAEEIYVNGGN